MAKQLKLFKKPVKKNAKTKGGPSTPSASGGLRSGNKKGGLSKNKLEGSHSTVLGEYTPTSPNPSSGRRGEKQNWHWTDYFVSSPLKLPPRNKRTKPVVFVGMSGGVDSSFTAYTLKEHGFEVVGVFMKNWSFPIKRIQECPLYQDYKDMVKVCKFLKIPYLVFSFEKDYRKRVIDPFFKGYEEGITPNPDVLCNTEIKFDNFLKESIKMGADFIATGHHIRKQTVSSIKYQVSSKRYQVSGVRQDTRGEEGIKCQVPDKLYLFPPASAPAVAGQAGQVWQEGSYLANSSPAKGRLGGVDRTPDTGHLIHLLLKGKDPIKDQTYFVYGLTQDQLAKCLFPIGEYVKSDLRALAKKANLPTAERRDSQGICFIGNINVKPFLKTRLPEKEGDIVTKDGKKVGKHEGAWFYTIGQRRIEGLSGTIKPMYVIGKDVKNNLVIVGDDKDTYSKSARLVDLHLINQTIKPKDLMDIVLTAKSRYTPEVSRGKLKKDKKGYYFEFIKPERAITAGQSLVLYKGEICLGGGVIK